MKQKNKRVKVLLALLCSLLPLLILSVGGVFAYITSTTDTVTNTFLPTYVSCEVERETEGTLTKNVIVKNTSEIDAYIRATIIVNWVSDDGKVLASSPQLSVDYTILYGEYGWELGADGYMYYTDRVAPDTATKPLADAITQLSEAPDGYTMQFEVIATAIQADPPQAVADAWSVSVTDGKLTPIR